MEGAARELGDEAAEGVGKAALRMTQLAGEILMGIAVLQDVSLGGGGGAHNDLPKKKDDEWDRLLFDAFSILVSDSILTIRPISWPDYGIFPIFQSVTFALPVPFHKAS